MKSLLKTLPQEVEIEFWGIRIRTNLAAVEEFTRGGRHGHPVFGSLADLIVKIEVLDEEIESASAVLAGHNFKLSVSPKKREGGRARVQKQTVKTVRCRLCKERYYPGSERKKSSHRRGCTFILALEVMEG